MDTNEKIHKESLKILKKFAESYIPNKSYKKHENSSSNVHKNKRFSPDIKKTKKMHLNDNIINSSKYNHNKSQDKTIKKNFVNQKFKIANDFNEENSNKFLNEIDESLKEEILSDKIEKEESIPFNDEDEKENLCEISSIKKDEYNGSLNNNHFKRKKYIDSSIEFLSELIDDLK